MEPSGSSLTEFLESNNLNNLIKSNTCLIEKSSYIDPIRTSTKYSFTFTGSQTAINDHHRKIDIFLFKSCFRNTESKLLNYGNFNYFPRRDFKEDLREAPCYYGNSYNDFDCVFTTKQTKHVPKRESGLGEIISPMLMNRYARPL